MDKYIKWGYFIVCIEEIIAEELIGIYIREVFVRYKVLEKIILDRDLKFVLEF